MFSESKTIEIYCMTNDFRIDLLFYHRELQCV